MTAMQELIEWHRKSMRSYSETNKMIEVLLEKEKEQIMNAYYEGHTAPYFSQHGKDVEKQAKKYYNQTYNQNK